MRREEGGTSPQPKTLCTKIGSNQFFLQQILLPIGKTPRRGREHSQSISELVTKSFRSPLSPLQHQNRVKKTYRGSKTCFTQDI